MAETVDYITVRDLIEQLKELDQDLPVASRDSGSTFFVLGATEKPNPVKNRRDLIDHVLIYTGSDKLNNVDVSSWNN